METKTRKTQTLKGRSQITYHCTKKGITRNLEVLSNEAGLSVQAYIDSVICEKAKQSNAIRELENEEIKGFCLKITKGTLGQLRNIAFENDTSINSVIVSAINEYLKK